MTYFYKLAFKLLRNEAYEMLIELRQQGRPGNSVLFNTGFYYSRYEAIDRFYTTLFPPNSEDMNDTDLYNLLRSSTSDFQRTLDDIHEGNGRSSIDSTKKIRLLLVLIKDECSENNAWDEDCNAYDPYCIFKSNILEYIISKLTARSVQSETTFLMHRQESESTIPMLRQELERIDRIYSQIESDTSKLECIRLSLENISRFASERSALNQPPTGIRVNFFGSFSIRLPPERSGLQLFVQTTERQLQDLAQGPRAVLPQTQPQSQVALNPRKDINASPKRLSYNERYDALISNDELETLGYTRAELNGEWICGITLGLPEDPVSSGVSYKGLYDRESLVRWLKTKRTDPNTREAVQEDKLIPLPHIKEQIERFLLEQEAIKHYYEHCLERGFTSQSQSMALVPRLG